MKSSRLLVIVAAFFMPLFLICNAYGAAGNRINDDKYPRVISAYHDKGTHLIRFGSFEPLDWKSLAPQWTKSFNPPEQSPEIVASLKALGYDWINEYGSTVVKFETELPAGLFNETYYLISSNGITELHPWKLKGEVTFDWNLKSTVIESIHYSGEVMARPGIGDKSYEGGFVVRLNKSTPERIIKGDSPAGFSAVVEGRDIVISYENDKREMLTLRMKARHKAAIDKSFSFSINDATYIFIQWKADGDCDYGCCEFFYSIFETSSELREIEWTAYGCDI